MAAKTKKAIYTDLVLSAKDVASNTYVMEGDTIYEITVIRKFKAKLDENGALVVPKVKGGK